MAVFGLVAVPTMIGTDGAIKRHHHLSATTDEVTTLPVGSPPQIHERFARRDERTCVGEELKTTLV
jgi:hypothetical protein